MFPVVTNLSGSSAKASIKGMRVLTVNGTVCRDSVHTAALLRMANAGAVTIVAGSHNMVAG